MTRGAWAAGVLTLALLAGCGKKTEEAKAPEAAGEAPARLAAPTPAPGLWNFTISSQGMEQTFKLCLDVATSKRMSPSGQVSSADVCKQTSARARPGGGWDFTSSCDMGDAGHMDTVSTVSGDMASKFQSKSTITTTGAKLAESNGVVETNLSAELLGACPPDFGPGDMELPGGQRMNITQAG
jgi:hypothetical protein